MPIIIPTPAPGLNDASLMATVFLFPVTVIPVDIPLKSENPWDIVYFPNVTAPPKPLPSKSKEKENPPDEISKPLIFLLKVVELTVKSNPSSPSTTPVAVVEVIFCMKSHFSSYKIC
jgi:hypothetical protein